MLRTLLAAATVILASAACTITSNPEATQPQKRPQLVDLTDEFTAFWQKSQGMEDAARAAAFKAHFEPVLPGYYAREKAGPIDYNGLILKALKSYPEQRGGIEEVSRRFGEMMGPARASFQAAFGPLDDMRPIYLLHSLGEMDGGVRNYRGGPTMFFGRDVIARNHLGHAIQPFFHHELFHAFHRRHFSGCDQVWCGLWSAGLAVHVANTLNPGATDARLLLIRPVPLRPAVEANRREALCTILGQLDSDQTSNLFSGGGKSVEDLPARAGYYIGYLAAAEAGKTRSLQTLAKLPNEQVRPLVEASLRSLTACA